MHAFTELRRSTWEYELHIMHQVFVKSTLVNIFLDQPVLYTPYMTTLDCR